MIAFEFALRIDQRLGEEHEMDQVYARCQDASLLVDGAARLVQFHREDSSLQNAIQPAIADVNAAGYHVSHVELQPNAVAVQTV
jgi:hypothetical protein